MATGAVKLPHRTKKRFQRQTHPGALPGSVVTHPEASRPIVRLVRYGPDDCTAEEITDIESLPGLLHQSEVTWVDVDGLGDAEVILRIGEIFELHPLALEDAVNVHQRPKIELYGEYLFLIARVHPHSESLETEQVAIFLGRGFVVSFRERGVDCLDSVHKQVRAGKGKVRTFAADYLLYCLLDAMIDSYFPVLERYGEKLDALDDQISSNEEHALISQIHNVRAELLSLRRSVWPLREALNSLIRDSDELVSGETVFYLRDCYDHTMQIIDVIETDRELCADLRDYYLTVVSNRMNQVMKFLTVIATLFIPLGFITGLYGMNFNTNASPWNMPELNWTLGYPFALTVMITTATGLVAFFWRKGWLS